MTIFAFLDLSTPDFIMFSFLIIFVVAIVMAVRAGYRMLTNSLDRRYVRKDNDIE